MKRIILTGGGTAGHVTPNLALLPALNKKGYDIRYIGSHNGIEKKLITEAGIPYDGISSGKLRRYFDFKNFSDPFRVVKGCLEARKLIKKFRPDVVFSKGGFVAVPVVLAASHYHIPVIIHESDISPGLANKLCISSATKICCNFPETLDYLPKEKTLLTGAPIRAELLKGERLSGLKYTGLSSNKPIILVMGGSLGSVTINAVVREILQDLLKDFQIIHVCGKGNQEESLKQKQGYVQYEYVGKQLKDLFAAASLVVSRAGANAICELLALRKPNILIPLSEKASRGDQVQNAASFEKQGFSSVITEENLTKVLLIKTIVNTYEHRKTYIAAMEHSETKDAVTRIIDLIEEVSTTS